MRSSIVYKYSCDTCQKVYFGATGRHFSTRQSEHMKGKNKSEIAFHIQTSKKTNFEVLGKFNHPFIAETLYICMADINSLLYHQPHKDNKSMQNKITERWKPIIQNIESTAVLKKAISQS